MGRREALTVARKIYSDSKQGLYPHEKFGLTLRSGYILRALDRGCIRVMDSKPGDRWSLDDIRDYAKEFTEYVSGISRIPRSPAADMEVRRLQTLSRRLCAALE